jgi:aminoglycoside phosphotransferase (APT) family kinase protein
MAKQRSTKVPRISKTRLREIEAILQDACVCMEELEIPDTVVHNDINAGNILFRGTRCVFTDWCEVGVGNPFFTFELLSKLRPMGEELWTPKLREAFRQSWLCCLNESQIERAFALSPLLAILSYLYGRGTWLHSVQRHDPGMESHARSLARHMDRAAQAPELMEATCR